jgi:hypothetical protein
MPPPEETYSVAELARSLRDVFTRLEGLARRLEDGQFVRTDLYNLYRESVNQALAALQAAQAVLERDKADKSHVNSVAESVKTKADTSSFSGLEARVAQLEDDKKWLVRLIIGFIILGVLGAVFTVATVQGK